MGIGSCHIHLDRVDSTNEECFRRLAARGPDAVEGLLVTAEHQSRGRGRRGHSWLMPGGTGLSWSIVLRDRNGLPPPVFSLLGGVAVWRMLRERLDLPAVLDWPNDVMVHDRKIAGVLAETRSTVPGVVVLGIGLNCLQTEADLRQDGLAAATSLAILGHPLAPARASSLLIEEFERLQAPLSRGRTQELVALWRTALGLQGCEVVVHHTGGRLTGRLLDVTDRAALVLELEDLGQTTLRGEHVTRLRALRAHRCGEA